MKKSVLSLIAGLMLAAPAALAQDEIFDNPENRAYLGVRLGVDISCPTDLSNNGFHIDLFKPGAGFDAGVVYNIPLWKNLYFEPGLSIFYSTMKSDVYLGDVLGESDIRISARQFGFRVPLRVGYHFDFESCKVMVFTGPRVSLPVVGRLHYSGKSTDGYKISDSDNLYGDDSNIRRCDIGWQFGAGVNYGNWLFEISGTVGMLDMYKGPGSFHENGVDITVGYNF